MSTQDIQDLLKEIEEAEKRADPEMEVSQTKRTVERGLSRSLKTFIQGKNIIAGTDKIPNYFIYRMYLDFEPWTPKVSKIEFFRQFKKAFTGKRTGKGRYYLLDGSKFEMTEEMLAQAKELDKK